MTKTTNYQLNQWDPEDRVIRTDFNEDNAKIDAALQSIRSDLQASTSKLQSSLEQAYTPDNKCFVTGTYTGDGASSRIISLGFTPAAVLLFNSYGTTYTSGSYIGGLSIPGATIASGLLIVTGGFRVAFGNTVNDIRSNVSNSVYYYIAFR